MDSGHSLLSRRVHMTLTRPFHPHVSRALASLRRTASQQQVQIAGPAVLSVQDFLACVKGCTSIRRSYLLLTRIRLRFRVIIAYCGPIKLRANAVDDVRHGFVDRVHHCWQRVRLAH